MKNTKAIIYFLLFFAVGTLSAEQPATHENAGDGHKYHHGHGAQPDGVDPSTVPTQHRHMKHLEVYSPERASHVAVESGDWADAATWGGELPGEMATVLIPEGIVVDLGARLVTKLRWIRIDGILQISPNADTALKVTTIFVTPEGEFWIGRPENPVDAGKSVIIDFLPRTEIDYKEDEGGIGGGLLSLGTVNFHGSKYDSFSLPVGAPGPEDTSVEFANIPKGWKVGDELLFPASTINSADEIREIVSIDSSKSRVTLNSALAHDHKSPDGINVRIPVGNLSRNVVLRSSNPDKLKDRGHTIFMTHTVNKIRGVRFEELGRTQADIAHTKQDTLSDGTATLGNNPIGRYAVHYHLRHGADRREPPQIFEGNSVVGSPKHGVVNHGGYVDATNNVTFNVAGSHFFSENGAEIGSFRNNLAVNSTGSGEFVRARDMSYDFGHGGHGFWVTSPAVEMSGNYAFNHASAAYVIFGRPVVEFGKSVKFKSANLDPSYGITPEADEVPNGAVPFRFSDNVGGNVGKGIETWNISIYPHVGAESVIRDTTIWDIVEEGIMFPYSKNLRLENVTMVAVKDIQSNWQGIALNYKTEDLIVRNSRFEGFNIGITVPRRGKVEITDCHLANLQNVYIESPVQNGRSILLAGNTFDEDFGLSDYHLCETNTAYNGDIGIVCYHDRIRVVDGRFSGQLYFAEQHSSAVPFKEGAAGELSGQTAQWIWDNYRLAVGGQLCPVDAERKPRVVGLVGVADATEVSEPLSRFVIDQGLDKVSAVKGEKDGWQLVKTEVNGKLRTEIVHVDATPPSFELDPRIKLEIHPEDLKHGFIVAGNLKDKVGADTVVKGMMTLHSELKANDQGVVPLDVVYKDDVGNEVKLNYDLKVTDAAPRRGSNTLYYMQDQFGDRKPQAETPEAKGADQAP